VSNAGPRAVESETEQVILRDYRFAWTSIAQALEVNTLDPLEGPFVGIAKKELVDSVSNQRRIGLSTHYRDQNHKVQAVFTRPRATLSNCTTRRNISCKSWTATSQFMTNTSLRTMLLSDESGCRSLGDSPIAGGPAVLTSFPPEYKKLPKIPHGDTSQWPYRSGIPTDDSPGASNFSGATHCRRHCYVSRWRVFDREWLHHSRHTSRRCKIRRLQRPPLRFSRSICRGSVITATWM